MDENYICDICKINFLENGMIFTGSKGDFRYRVKPDLQNKRLLASVYTIYCYEFAKDVVEIEFELSQIGYEEMRKWIDNECKKFKYS